MVYGTGFKNKVLVAKNRMFSALRKHACKNIDKTLVRFVVKFSKLQL